MVSLSYCSVPHQSLRRFAYKDYFHRCKCHPVLTMWPFDCDIRLTRTNTRARTHKRAHTRTQSHPRNHFHLFCSTVNRLLVEVTAKAHASTSIRTQELLFLSFHVTILNGPLCSRRSYYAQQIIMTALAELRGWRETNK